MAAKGSGDPVECKGRGAQLGGLGINSNQTKLLKGEIGLWGSWELVKEIGRLSLFLYSENGKVNE